jgi:hypothetical protein
MSVDTQTSNLLETQPLATTRPQRLEGISVKQEFMKQSKRPTDIPGLFLAPLYPHDGKQVFSRLRTALGEVLGEYPSYPRLGQMAGVSPNTIHYWLNVFEHAHVRCFLSLLERLPEPKRRELLRFYCRELPTLASPRFDQSVTEVSSILRLLSKRSGLTLISGGSPFERTFVLSSIGHSFLRMHHGNEVAGLDVYEPREWVPLESVLYVQQPQTPKRLKELLRQAWPLVRQSRATLLLLNGVWSAMPEAQLDILNQVTKRHLVIADGVLETAIANRTQEPSHLIQIESTPRQGQLIQFKVTSP